MSDLATSIGMRRKGRDRWGPCPACRADRTRNDARPPVRIRNDWWTCYACGEWGDAVDMAAAYLGHGTRPRGRAFLEARALAEGGGTTLAPLEAAPTREPERLPVAPVLRRALPLHRAPAPVLDWLRSRALPTDVPAGYLPDPPRWFPLGFPVVVPAFSAGGALMSMHGHGVDGEHKTAWPMGPWPCQLLMADPRWARPFMRGLAPAPDVLILTEGMTDYLTSAMHYPTIGLASGSVPALKLLRIPSTTRVFSAMDPDRAGARYDGSIADALWPIPVRRLPLERLVA